MEILQGNIDMLQNFGQIYFIHSQCIGHIDVMSKKYINTSICRS
jgi:hypothetical protein